MVDLHKYGTSTGKLRLLEPDKKQVTLFTSNQTEVEITLKYQEPTVTGANYSDSLESTLSTLKERPSMSSKAKMMKDKTSSYGASITV